MTIVQLSVSAMNSVWIMSTTTFYVVGSRVIKTNNGYSSKFSSDRSMHDSACTEVNIKCRNKTAKAVLVFQPNVCVLLSHLKRH